MLAVGIPAVMSRFAGTTTCCCSVLRATGRLVGLPRLVVVGRVGGWLVLGQDGRDRSSRRGPLRSPVACADSSFFSSSPGASAAAEGKRRAERRRHPSRRKTPAKC